MNLSHELATHLRQLYTGGNWTSVNLRDTLSDVGWEQATSRVASFNTIAALVYHINYYVDAVLKVLEERDCPYVPRLLEEHPEELYFVSTACGQTATSISKERSDQLFAELERDYGVRHLDPEPRNITYDPRAGRFCIIDFELAEILPPPAKEPG